MNQSGSLSYLDVIVLLLKHRQTDLCGEIWMKLVKVSVLLCAEKKWEQVLGHHSKGHPPQPRSLECTEAIL